MKLIRFTLLMLSIIVGFQGFSQDVIISEIVANNNSGYTNQNGETPDWIEIQNISTHSINLADYKISDKNGVATPWQLPAVTLAAGAYYVIEASDPTDTGTNWESIIINGATWKYLIPTSQPDNAWKTVTFDDSGWAEGASGFGNGDNDDKTILPVCTSVFIRKNFTVTDKAQIIDAFLHMDYDDGFVAYINGHEVARAAMLGKPTTFDEFSTGHEANLYQNIPIEGFQITNLENILVNGLNTIAIEVHNSSATSSDLTAIPILTLGFINPLSNPMGVSNIIPLQNNSSIGANFKINAENETIYLLTNDAIIDSIEITDLPLDVSIGRINKDKNTLHYFSTPTPKAANSIIKFEPETLSKPIVSSQGGKYKDPFYLTLFSTEENAKIYYTTNGSIPTQTSTLYTDSILISKTTNLRAIAIKTGYLPSSVKTESYIFESRPQTLPIVSVTFKNEDFFNWNTGIYVLGPNAESWQPNFGANFWEDWERPCHLEIFTPDGKTVVSQDIGVKIAGNWSRANPQKSLKFYSRSQYGDKEIKYQFFKDKPIYEFQSFILRNAGNDFYGCHMRDGMISGLVRNTGVDRVAYTPAVVYLNGVYYGIQNFREKPNEDYVAANHGIDVDSLSLIDFTSDWGSGFGNVIHGSNKNFDALYTFIRDNDISIPANYERVKQDLDVENYMKFNIIQMYTVNEDWPGNNTKIWRENNANGKWRYILYDLDFGFGNWDAGKVANNMLEFALANDTAIKWPNPQWSTLMLRQLTQNQDFNNQFLNYTADLLNTTLYPDTVLHHVDSIIGLINSEIEYHAPRWGNKAENMRNDFQVMRDFAIQRDVYMREHFEQHFNTNGSYNLTLESSHLHAGKIHVNSIDISTFPWTGKYFKNIPITITAIPAAGYTFIRWEGAVNSTNPTISITTENATKVKAIFNYDATLIPQVIITEINYNSSNDNASGDWIELYNAKNTSQDISNWIVKDAQVYNSYRIPQGTIIPANSYVVLCNDTVLFRTQYLSNTIDIIGNVNFNFSKNIETISLLDSNANVIDAFSYSDEMPWPKKCDGYGFTLQLTNIQGDRTDPLLWRAATKGGTPGIENNPIILTPNRKRIVINEINYNSHSNSDSGDWFELFNSGSSTIDISEWVIRDNDNDNIFVIPQGTTIQGNSYVVFCQNPEKFEAIYPTVPYINTNIGLHMYSDAVRIYDQYEFLIDSVEYIFKAPWPLGANGTGKTLTLPSFTKDNSKGENWIAGPTLGTPGKENTTNIADDISSLTDRNYIYPNPCEETLYVTYNSTQKIEICTMVGLPVIIKNSGNLQMVDISTLQSGTYTIKIYSNEGCFSHIFVKL